MPSIFKEITKVVLQEMNAKDMIAVQSLVDADRFYCLYLVREEKSIWGRQYCSTDITLQDILEEEESKGLSDERDSVFRGEKTEFGIEDSVDTKGEATMKVSGEVTITGSFQGSHELKLKLLSKRLSTQYLNTLQNKKLKKDLPASFQSFPKEKNLYIVTETLETEKEETLTSIRQYKLWDKLYQIVFGLEHKHRRKLTIPSNRVLCYRIKQLVFPTKDSMKVWLNDGVLSSLGKCLGLEDSRDLKVPDMLRGLQDLTEQERKDVLSTVTTCLGKDGQLQDLKQRVTEVLDCGELQDEGPAGPLICSLFNAAGNFVKERAEAILGLLDALIEISEDWQLVVEALEMGALPRLKDEVTEVLDCGELQDEGPAGPLICSLFNAAGNFVKERAEAILGLLDALIEISEDWQLVVEALEMGALPRLKDEVKSIMDNWGNIPDKDCNIEQQSFRALYVVASILLQLKGEPTSVSS
ncbi:Gasdermin-B [Tupaia chinensis]|uniref:Gasdermin-B n=1 Tax=Tupaia chinensis TaxID=246437 RepID=L9JXE8_TUPCH|nr:Gasdermin-B [Tupaia chinensis]